MGGMNGSDEEPDPDFVKYVNLGVKFVVAKVTGGRATFMLFLHENNYHLKGILERQVGIDGMDDYFAVPCKYFTRKVVTHSDILFSVFIHSFRR